MVTITDVSPNLTFGPSWQFTTGRMLSVDSSDDGSVVFAGAFSSNLWRSSDGGVSWAQLAWEQPVDGQFTVPGAIGGYCVPSIAVGPDSASWAIATPRLLADVTGNAGADIVGFGETGVWTSLSRGDGTFEPPRVVLAEFGVQAGGWQLDRHPRLLGDLTGNAGADIVGFGDAGVYTSLSNGDGTFGASRFVVADLGYDQGWRIGEHPRLLADVTGDGNADIVGFGNAGVYVALSRGDGTFAYTPAPVLDDFGVQAGGWTVDRHPRLLADLTGDGRADIVGFGDAGVWVALSNGDGTFAPARFVLEDFGYQQGWRVDEHPRFLADITGDGRADIVGFGDAGVYVALSNGDGTFGPARFVLADLGYQLGWRVDKHVRVVADVTGDGHADLVGFGDAGVYVASGNGDGTFGYQPIPVITDFGYDAGGWRVDEHPRFVADITGGGRADIVGFGDAGVYVAQWTSPAAAPVPRFVLPNFGTGLVVLAMVQCDRADQDAGIWRSSDGGDTWARVHAFPRRSGAARLPGAGQLVWVPGTANLVYAAGGSSLAVSTDAGATFTDLMPIQPGTFQTVTHVAASAVSAGSLIPQTVYALAPGKVFVSFDAGQTWTADTGNVPNNVGGSTGTANSQNERVLVVSPRSALEVFATGDANLTPPQLWRGDYSSFAQNHESHWTPLALPILGQQYSGNVFLAATRPGQGEAIFYGPQRSQVFAASLDPQSASDWHALDSTRTHVDLHGIFLAPDFSASFDGGSYRHRAGTMWLASDGGLFRSTDGGDRFDVAGSISTLSVVNIAGVAISGSGPVIAMGTGDNDGFVTKDGGLHWQPQDYGGGDDDCAWSDPLRPNSMLVFTPRWDEHGASVTGGRGQTITLYETAAGHLPDPSDSGARHVVPGPPVVLGSSLWNATSGYGIRGYRPIVLDLPGDAASQPVDYLVIRFYGNLGNPVMPNNLAVLMRARNLPAITKRTDWDTPGGWQVDKHPRLLGDITGNGHADIVGFGDAGVWTALATSRGSFASPRFVLADLGYHQGWRVDKHPRFLADITGDGTSDIVAFGDAGVYVALADGSGGFGFTPTPAITDFGSQAGGWQVDRHPRFLADITGDGTSDIVGFGDAGVYVALSNGDGTFGPVRFVVDDFGYQQGWRVDQHPRLLADLTGNGRADIVGFGNAGVYVASSNGDGTFAYTPVPVLDNFGVQAGSWHVDKHVRVLADVTGDGSADIVGFGDAGVYVAVSNGNGTFADATKVIDDFGYDQGWRVNEHPRLVADITGDRLADIVGFGDAGVLVDVHGADGNFGQRALFVIPNFGRRDSGPVEQVGPFLPDPNIGVVQAAGGHDTTMFYVGGDTANRLWKWTDGMLDWQQIIPSTGAAAAHRFFVNPYDPNDVYVLDTNHVLHSIDGGQSWQVDTSLEQQLSDGGRISISRDQDADGQGDHYDVVLSDMRFDPYEPQRRFAVGLAGAFMTTDAVNWTRLLDTEAMRGRPANCYFDWISNPNDPALYVSFAGRGIVKIDDFAVPVVEIAHPPQSAAATDEMRAERPPTRVRTTDGSIGTLAPMPDERVRVNFDDGTSLVVDADRLRRQDDGTYAVD